MCLCTTTEEVGCIQTAMYAGEDSAVQRRVGSKYVADPTENVHLFLREVRTEMRTIRKRKYSHGNVR